MRCSVSAGFLVLIVVVIESGTTRARAQHSQAKIVDTRGFFGMLSRFTTTTPSDNPKSPLRTCDCTCGDRVEPSRIVGGKPASELPWMVKLSYFGRFYCGGTLINDLYVLTAAHCVKRFIWFLIEVSFGEHNRCNNTVKPETRFVTRAILNDFSFMNFDHDIALLRLNKEVPLNNEIGAICLPTNPDNLYVGVKAIAAGWGTLHEDGKPACILQEVDVPVMSNSQCKMTNYHETMISDNMMCAGYVEGKKDSCQGDSGGPLAYEREDKRYEIIGIVSWGNGCARPNFPGVYTRVTRYLDWIKKYASDGCFCKY